MRTSHIPAYFNLLHTGELSRRAAVLEDILKDCTLCPRDCRVDRTRDEHGFCRSGYLPVVASYCAHFGEEPVLSGTRGSGTIFFGNCNMRCVFCQNHQISQPTGLSKKHPPMPPLIKGGITDPQELPPLIKEGTTNPQELPPLNKGGDGGVVSFERLAEMMIELQSMGCHNINFVSPSHFPAQIIKAVEIAAVEGLRLPLVYNTNGYDSLETLKLLDGIIDIYLPDIKYSNDKYARQYSKAREYVRYNRAAIIEMKQQVGDLIIDEDGIAVKGLLIRHLVLPNDLSDSGECLKFISEEIGRGTYLSTMSQYFPAHKAGKYPLLSRPIRESEYEKVLEWLDKYHLENGWVQDYSSKDYYCPDFDREEPFKKLEHPSTSSG